MEVFREPIQKLIEWIENASPMLWAVAQRQVWVQFAQTILGLVVCSGMAIGLFMLGKWFIRKDKTDDPEMVAVFCWIGAGIAGVIAVMFFIVELPRYLNWDYLAIQNLVRLSPF
jgi:hypothetical protein